MSFFHPLSSSTNFSSLSRSISSITSAAEHPVSRIEQTVFLISTPCEVINQSVWGPKKIIFNRVDKTLLTFKDNQFKVYSLNATCATCILISCGTRFYLNKVPGYLYKHYMLTLQHTLYHNNNISILQHQ